MPVTTHKRQIKWALWGLLGLVAFLSLVYMTKGIMLPFILGIIFAYLLDPLADRLQKWGMGRLWATTLIVGIFIMALVMAMLLLVPILIDQFKLFVTNLPLYWASLLAWIMSLVHKAITFIPHGIVDELTVKLNEYKSQYATAGVKWAGGVLGDVISGGFAFLSILSLIVITPIVTFYTILDWDRIVKVVDSFIPRPHVAKARQLFRDIDGVLSGFIRGQFLVCCILGAFYGLGLTLVGLELGLAIGLGAGLISFIPYVGSILGFLVSMGVAFAQFDTWEPMALVAAVFFVGQFLEGNFLSPKLVGDRVKLHPVWMMFALLAAGSLLGFVGILVAVPVAAVIGVLARFIMSHWRQSQTYLGTTSAPKPPSKAKKK